MPIANVFLPTISLSPDSSLFFFFFSSRRRHTRFKCDWNSDVCSSDLEQHVIERLAAAARGVDEDAQIVAQLALADELLERRWPDRGFRRILLGALGGEDSGCRVRSEERRVGKEWSTWWASEQ